MNDREPDPYFATRTYRAISAVFGFLLVASGLYVLLLTGSLRWPQIAGGLLLVAFGGDLLISARRSRASWLSRIGPLP